MNFAIEHELILMSELAARAGIAANVGYVLPSPILFNDIADFWAAVNPKLTQKAIETTPIAFCMMSILKEEDDPSKGCDDNPLKSLTVNFYLFRQYAPFRADESNVPDAFLKKLLQSYVLFRSAWRNLKNEFQGTNPIPGMPDGWEVNSKSLIQNGYADYKAKCEIIPNLKGYSVNLQSEIEIIIPKE